jgi:hypothetical protein
MTASRRDSTYSALPEIPRLELEAEERESLRHTAAPLTMVLDDHAAHATVQLPVGHQRDAAIRGDDSEHLGAVRYASSDDRADQLLLQRPPDATLQRPGAVLLIEPSRTRRATSPSLTSSAIPRSSSNPCPTRSTIRRVMQGFSI